MKAFNLPTRARSLGPVLIAVGLLGSVACQASAPPAPTAPTTAPAKPTTAPAAAAPAASPAAATVPSPPSVPTVPPAASPSPSPAASPAAAAGRVLTFDAADYSFNTPDSIPAGRVTLVMRNTGREDHHGQLLRLNTGVTLDQFMAALRQGEGPAMALVSLDGGTGAVGAGQTSEVTLDLKEGTFVMICFIPSPDGIPHLAKGMVKPIQVTAPPTAAGAAPVARETFTAKDFSFEMPNTLPAGRNTYRVVNAGPTQPHELIFVRLAAGKTGQDAVAFWTGEPQGPPPYTNMGGMQGLSPNGEGWTTTDLAPGSYAAICVIPEPASGKAHIELGMIKEFTVR